MPRVGHWKFSVAPGFVAAAVAFAALGCSKSKEEAEQQATPTSAERETEPVEPTPPPPPPRRSELAPWRPLLEEVSRAEIDVGGQLIDLGDAATHKWVGGGWKNAWGRNRHEEDGTTLTAVNGAKAEMPFLLWEDDAVAEVVMRARSACKGQRASVRIDATEVGAIDLTDEWQTYRVPVKADKAPQAGWRELGFLFGRSCGETRAELDWVWLSAEVDAEPPKIVDLKQTLTIGDKPARALPAPTPRTYAWYLMVPEEAELVFDYGSSAPGTKFVVRVRADGEPAKTLFDEAADSEWKEGAVKLDEFAGKAVRLELETTGEAGDTGWGEVALMVPLSEAPKPAASSDRPPKNVVMIVIDTVRADVFEPYGGEGSPVKTPAFDDLTKTSTYFSAAYDNENWTKPSIATILSGLYPTTHDTKKDDSTLPDEVEILPERLKKEGFQTASFIANGYVSEKYNFTQGWDFHRNYIRESRNSSAENVYDDAIEWLDEHEKEPYFLYIQTIDPHVPYRTRDRHTEAYLPPEKSSIGSTVGGRELAELSKKDLSENDLAWVIAMYRGEVSYHDEHMGRFIGELEKRGHLEDTLIVITNDHGEELKEHGRMGHGHSLYDEVVRAPLLFRYPGRFPAQHQIDEPVESVDIVPTVLDVLRLDGNEDLEGFSLMPLVEGDPLQRPFYAVSEFLYGQRSVRIGPYKLIRSGSKYLGLFDVSNDPTEQKDLIDESLIARRMAEIHLAEYFANPNKRMRRLDRRVSGKKFSAGTVEMDPELKKQLEALGYFGDE